MERRAPAPVALDPLGGVPGGERYCPRCDAETLWTNIRDGGLVFYCTLREEKVRDEDGKVIATDHVDGCGLDSLAPMTDDEHERFKAYAARLDPAPTRRAWQFV